MAEPEPLKGIDTAADSDGVKMEVEPELSLWLTNGTTVKSLSDLASAMKKMKAADYKEHVNPERNEIAEWVQEVLNDESLARALRKAKGKLTAAQQVEKEIKALKIAAKQTLKAAKMPKAMPVKVATAAMKKEKTAKANVKRQPRLQASKVELPLPEISLAEPEAGKKSKSLWPFRKKMKTPEERQLEIEMPELEMPQFPDIKMDEDMMPEEQAEPVKLPEMPNMQMPEPTPEVRVAKEKKRFLFFKRKPKQEKVEEVAELSPLQNFPQLPNMGELPSDDSGFEPEPQHQKWTEDEKPQEEAMTAAAPMEEDAAPEILIPKTRKARQPKVKVAKKAEPEPMEDAGLQRKMRAIEKQEKELNHEEEELNARRLDLTRKRYDLIKQKGDLERERFEAFMEKHKLTGKHHTASREEPNFNLDGDYGQPQRGGMPDFKLSGAYGKERLEELLEQAKQRIRENNFGEAQKALHEVQSVFNTVFMSTTEKKQIEYEILEVEADLKLASLG